MNGIKIFGENFINGDNGYTFLSGSSSENYLYDQKPTTQWLSVGSDDTTEEYIEISFKNWQGATVSRTFDRIIILNHNIKACQCQYWDGSAWQDITGGSLSANTAASNLLEIASPVSSEKFKIKITTTQVADTEKVIGELKVCKNIMAPYWLSRFSRSDSQKSGAYNLLDGPLVFWKEWTKAGGTLNIIDIEKSDFDTIFPYFKTANFITVLFHNDFDLDETLELAITSAPNYILNRKTKLYQISMELRER